VFTEGIRWQKQLDGTCAIVKSQALVSESSRMCPGFCPGASQFLYIPSDFQRNSPPTPSFFPGNQRIFEQTDGVLRRRVTSPNWGLLGQSGHGGSEGCNRAPRTAQIQDSSALQPSCLPTSSNPHPPRHPWLGAGLALRWRHGGATVALPWAPTPMGPASHRLATA
jgi:hypothetical protein